MLRDTWNSQEESALQQYKGPRKDVCDSRTTERAKEETPKHSKGRRKVLTTSLCRLLGHEKPEAHGQMTN